MRVRTVFIIKTIVSVFFKSLICFILTALIVGLVVIQYPEDPMSYVLLSFVLVVDGLLLFTMIPPPRKIKYKPRTISKPIVFWLFIVLYCCAAGVAMLTNAYILADKQSIKILILVFDCLFAAMGIAAFAGLFYQFVGYLLIVHCLKHGTETTAKFLGMGKMLTATYGRPHTKSFATITGYSVVFSYVDSDGKEKTEKSKCVFSYDEVEQLEKSSEIKIKYNKRLAVIVETFEPKNDEEKAAGNNA